MTTPSPQPPDGGVSADLAWLGAAGNELYKQGRYALARACRAAVEELERRRASASADAADARDAERYRWVRADYGRYYAGVGIYEPTENGFRYYVEDQADTAIDAAMEAERRERKR